jgi:DNA-binding CsgD family transcriptional regulator
MEQMRTTRSFQTSTIGVKPSMGIESASSSDFNRSDFFFTGGSRPAVVARTYPLKNRAQHRRNDPIHGKKSQREDALAMPPKLFGPDEWQRIVRALEFSPREAEITALVLHGMKDDAIARELGIKKPTVRTHLRKIFQSLGVDSRLGLALRVFATSRDIVNS